MSKIRCGIKTAKLGATVFGRRKPISKNWWVGLWPLEEEDVELSQPFYQNASTTSEGSEPAMGDGVALKKSDQLAGSEKLEGTDAS